MNKQKPPKRCIFSGYRLAAGLGFLKDEIDISWCKAYGEFLKVVTDWTDYYNNDRYQWDLAKLSPVQYYQYMMTGSYPLDIPKPKGGV